MAALSWMRADLKVSRLRKLEISMDRTSYLNQVLAQISQYLADQFCPLLCWVLLVFHLHWRLADALIMGVVGVNAIIGYATESQSERLFIPLGVVKSEQLW